MKIIVYTICKNEEKHVNRWFNSMKEADEIYVLDTGSTDNTVNKMLELGIKVSIKKYDKFRFDTARNDSLKLVPIDTDICVCTDLDEVFKSGWRKELEYVWNNTSTRCEYSYNWSKDISFMLDKIHSRNNYKWVNPVHEVLFSNKEIRVRNDKIILNHYPDNTKSRKSYLPLLEQSIKENPYNDRNYHYLGREYMYYKKYNECIDTLIKHLNLKSATWKDERCASMRFIARSYKNLGRYKESEMWYKLAIRESPYLRDAFVELSILYYELEEWYKVIHYINKSLKIKKNNKTYINESFSFNEIPYELLSLAYYYTKRYKAALKYNLLARQINDNERLINNYKIIKNKC